MRAYWGRKRDQNERDIVAALEQAGLTVVRHFGKGEPDLFVQEWSRTSYVALEVKRPAVRGRLTAQQSAWAGPRYIVSHCRDALFAAGVPESEHLAISQRVVNRVILKQKGARDARHARGDRS
jgi:hypothetical protein